MLQQIHTQDILELIHGSQGHALDFTLQMHDSLPSTNEYIFEQIQSSAIANKTVVIALKQTAGKGRDGRIWISPPGNIYLSLYWQFNKPLQQLYGLSLTAGIAVARVLKNIGLEDVKLKWPNDIFWNGHKMGGILIETKTKGPGLIDTVIGLGLNIQDMSNYQQQISQKFVELESALQHKVYKNKLLSQILIEFDKVLTQFAAQGFESFVAEWKTYDTQQGRILDQAT